MAADSEIREERPPEPAGEPQAQPLGEPGILILLRALWRYKWIQLVSITLLLCVAVLRLYASVPVYEASAIIYPSTDLEPRRQLVGTGGGALSLLETGRGVPTAFDKYLAVMRTPDFAAEMDRRLDLAKRLFPRRWDALNHRWREPAGMAESLRHALGWQSYPVDPIKLLSAFLSRALTVTQPDKRIALTTISFKATDRQLAQDVLSTALDVARQLLIARQEEDLTHEIEYLETKLQTVQLVEHRLELSRLLSDQEREMMLLKAGTYGCAVLQPVYTPPAPVYPDLRVSLIIAGGLGFMIGSVIALLLALREQPRTA